MSSIDGKIFFLLGRELCRYQDDSFIHFFSFDYKKFSFHVCGRHEKDLFFGMQDGIAHYNGTDIEYIYKFPFETMRFTGSPLILDKEIFYCIRNYGEYYNLVLHGYPVES